MNKYLTLIKILTLIGATWSIAEGVQKCNPIRLANGRAKTQREGRLVRFRCLKKYEFVGRRYMNCFLGRWDFERDPSIHLPMCVRPGCQASSYVNGHFLETYKGAVVSVICNLGYTLIGPSTVYCDGKKWNRPFPECKAINPTPPKSCDFEKDTCGWTQDPYGDWKWHKSDDGLLCTADEDCKTPPYHLVNLGRYILLGNSSSRIANETERFFSPVFPPDYSNNTCFTFWYTIHGPTSGYLKVFVKPEGVDLYNTIPPFWVTGHQGLGNSWIPGYFLLYPLETQFQLVIEGMSLPGNDSVTAFDDVKILSEEDCRSFRDNYIRYSSTTAESVTYDGNMSCDGRCGTTGSSSMDRCDCRESCLSEDTCCSDYDIFCMGDETTSLLTTTEIATETTEYSQETATEKSTEESEKTPKHVGNDFIRNGSVVSEEGESAVTTASVAIGNGTTSTTVTSMRRTNRINFQFHLNPSHPVHVGKARIDGSIPTDRVDGTGEDSPLSIKSGNDHSTPTSSRVPSGTIEAGITVAALLLTAAVVAAFIRRRRRKKTEKESMVEDSDSISFGMNPIYEKLSRRSSLICIRPNGLVGGDTFDTGRERMDGC